MYIKIITVLIQAYFNKHKHLKKCGEPQYYKINNIMCKSKLNVNFYNYD